MTATTKAPISQLPQIKNDLYRRRSKAMVLAHQLMRHADISFAAAQRTAWGFLKGHGFDNFRLVKFRKNDGTVTTRIVSLDWQSEYTPNGNGRPRKPGQILMIDIAKKRLGMRALISTYIDRIEKTF